MNEPGQPPKKTFWLFFSTVVCVAGNSFLYGYNIGVLNSTTTPTKAFSEKVTTAGVEDVTLPYSDPLDFLLPNHTYVDDTENITQWHKTTTGSNVSAQGSDLEYTDRYFDGFTVALYWYFGMIGTILSPKVANYFGRKMGLIIIVPLMLLAAVIGGVSTVPKSSEFFLILVMFFRSCAGFHGGISLNLATTYLAEISPEEDRWFGENCHHVFIAIGFLCSMVFGLPQRLGNWNWWSFMFAFNAIPALAFFLMFTLCPESPRFLLIRRCDEDRARKELMQLRGTSDVEDELEKLKVEARVTAILKRYTLKQLLMIPELKIPVIGVFIFTIAQQLSGPSVIMCYSYAIFSQARYKEIHVPYLNVGLGFCLFVGVLVSRMVKISSLIVKCVMLVTGMFLVFFMNRNPLKDEINTDSVATVLVLWLYMLCCPIAFGFRTVPKLVEDTFPAAAHDVVRSIVNTVGGLCNSAFLLVFLFVQAWLHDCTYYIFVAALLGSIVADLLLRRGKKKQNDEITDVGSVQRLLEENKRLREAIICNRCNAKTKSVLYNQCGHILFCSSCDLSVYPKHCPECQEHIRPYTSVKLFPDE